MILVIFKPFFERQNGSKAEIRNHKANAINRRLAYVWKACTTAIGIELAEVPEMAK